MDIQDVKKVTSPYRCLATLAIALTLCVLAVVESTGAATARSGSWLWPFPSLPSG
ncbi:MAG: hypothetical protein JW846_06650 [Dehalococcoidia bacterium]|nr:hypothetical protein [Dehalococcoidia bacterium]